MHGAGYTSHFIKAQRNNRNLLKGSRTGTYRNFDKSYITNSIISRKAPIFKKASKEFLRKLNAKLLDDNKRIFKLRMVVMITSLLLVSVGFIYLFH